MKHPNTKQIRTKKFPLPHNIKTIQVKQYENCKTKRDNKNKSHVKIDLLDSYLPSQCVKHKMFWTHTVESKKKADMMFLQANQ